MLGVDKIIKLILNEYKTDIENLGKVIDRYGLFLVETARNLENIQNEIASQAGKL